jgi:hypothetical protein
MRRAAAAKDAAQPLGLDKVIELLPFGLWIQPEKPWWRGFQLILQKVEEASLLLHRLPCAAICNNIGQETPEHTMFVRLTMVIDHGTISL